MKKGKITRILKSDEDYTIQNDTICFLPGNRLPQRSAGQGLLGKIKDRLKKHGRTYYALLYLLSPVLGSQPFRKNLKSLLGAYEIEHVILNLGSGPTYLHGRKDIINVDIFAFDQVDIVTDATDLTIKDESVDLVLNIAMTEHVDQPMKVIEEMHRVLKKGGQFFCYLPFMVPYHAAPEDFHRWTIAGTKTAFSCFEEVEVHIGAGPTSGFLYIFQEWVAIALSFGSRTLHDIVFLTVMVLTAPIKLLDLLLARFPYAENIASGFCVVGKK
jgi:SAM-dependent methyltransferase